MALADALLHDRPPDLAAPVGAFLSSDGLYRYLLWRPVVATLYPKAPGPLLFIGFNPSTADAQHNDPTIRRMLGFARMFGASRLEVANLWALRATDPKLVARASTSVALAKGPDTDTVLDDAIGRAWRVVAAWGALGERTRTSDRVATVRGFAVKHGKTLHCLGKTREGYPRHPLYVRKGQPLEVWPR